MYKALSPHQPHVGKKGIKKLKTAALHLRRQGGTFGKQIKQFTTRNRSALIDQDKSSKNLLWSKQN